MTRYSTNLPKVVTIVYYDLGVLWY
eukprot:COSAG02_NODE_42766_length_381_cov_1.078014_1_plen_24_part_01